MDKKIIKTESYKRMDENEKGLVQLMIDDIKKRFEGDLNYVEYQ